MTFNLGAWNAEIGLFFRTFWTFFDSSRRFHDRWPIMAGIVFSLAYRLGTPFFRCIMHTSLHLTDTSAIGSIPSCYGSQAIFTRRFFKSWHDGRAILYMGIVVSTSLTFVSHATTIWVGSGVLCSPAMTYALKTHSSLLLRFVLALYPRGSYECRVVLLHCMLTICTFWPRAGFTWTRV